MITGILAFLIMLQPDLGSCLVLVLGAMVIITIGGANLKHIFVLGGSALALGIAYFGLSYLSNPNSNNYRLKRITTLFDPWSDSSDSTYQMVNSLLAFGHGGFTGTGLSRSIQKINFLSQSHSDFIFAIIGEELGFLGTSLFLLVYCLFVWRGIVVSLRNPDPYASLIGVGIMSMIAIQTLINIGGVTNSIPMTGITLPLISYGGSSVLATMISMGMVLSISRDQAKPSPNKKRT
ncbi:FtsW/RodA/SpoVE family cell cycle protein [Paenibacillus sp. CC-CFT747]|nr:FtsW/RodA/SpoVE family cell cycle protein [Paenibacillus sp. CC-CFT747]